jgi:dTDP-glucose pyrophosphorylase
MSSAGHGDRKKKMRAIGIEEKRNQPVRNLAVVGG